MWTVDKNLHIHFTIQIYYLRQCTVIFTHTIDVYIGIHKLTCTHPVTHPHTMT